MKMKSGIACGWRFVLICAMVAGTTGCQSRKKFRHASISSADLKEHGLLGPYRTVNLVGPTTYIVRDVETGTEQTVALRGVLTTGVPELERQFGRARERVLASDPVYFIRDTSTTNENGVVSAVFLVPRIDFVGHDLATGKTVTHVSSYSIMQLTALFRGEVLVDREDVDHWLYERFERAERQAKRKGSGFWGMRHGVEEDEEEFDSAWLEEGGMPEAGRDWISPSTGMEFVWIEAMDLWVGRYEVTNGEYRRKKPQHNSGEYEGYSLDGDRQPVVRVNWMDASRYADWLTRRDRKPLGELRYRLPRTREFVTYAQCGLDWEYPWGNDWPPRSGEAGNYADETYGEAFPGWSVISGYWDGHIVTAPVEESWANPWGLYGVGGNVWEYCSFDLYLNAFGGVAGASWRGINDKDNLRSTIFWGFDARLNNNGFRLVLSY